jgi:hypothetical protein
MAERTILVCDVCGEPATRSVTFEVAGRRLSKDYCAKHLAELTAGARAPRRGRAARARTTKSAVPARAAKRTRATAAAARAQVAAEVAKLRQEGRSYRQIGDALVKRGMKPLRAKRWNPVVLGRLAKQPSAS